MCFVQVDVGPDLELMEEKLHIRGLVLDTQGLCQGRGLGKSSVSTKKDIGSNQEHCGINHEVYSD